MSAEPQLLEIFNIVTLLVWAALQIGIVLTGILLFRVEKRYFNFLIILGGSLSFLAAVANLMFFFPKIGILNSGEFDSNFFVKYNAISSGIRLIADAMIVYGIFGHAWVFMKTRRSRQALNES